MGFEDKFSLFFYEKDKHTLRFIIFVAKILVLDPEALNGLPITQIKERICYIFQMIAFASPLIDRLINYYLSIIPFLEFFISFISM